MAIEHADLTEPTPKSGHPLKSVRVLTYASALHEHDIVPPSTFL